MAWAVYVSPATSSTSHRAGALYANTAILTSQLVTPRAAWKGEPRDEPRALGRVPHGATPGCRCCCQGRHQRSQRNQGVIGPQQWLVSTVAFLWAPWWLPAVSAGVASWDFKNRRRTFIGLRIVRFPHLRCVATNEERDQVQKSTRWLTNGVA